MKNFGKWIFAVEKGLGGLLLLLMLSFVFFATIGRYTRWYNMAWSDEAARYCMIWSVFLLAGISAQRGQMFSIDVLSGKLPLRGQQIFAVIRLVFMTVFCVFALIYGWDLVMHQMQISQTSPSLKIPMWLMYSCVPLGCLLLLLHYGVLVWNQLTEGNQITGKGGK